MRSRSVCTERLSLALAVGLGLSLASGCRPAGGASTTLVVDAAADDTDADVFVDGSYVGTVAALRDGDLPPVRLGPGVHRVEVRKAGRFPVQRTVRIDDGAPEQVVVAAELLEDPR